MDKEHNPESDKECWHILFSVTMTEGDEIGTYGECQCRSARQTDRRPQQAPGAQQHLEKAALVISQPHIHHHC